MTHLKLCKHNFNASSYAAKCFLSSAYTPLYIQEQGRTFVHTMNYLIVQQHHQNIQMQTQKLMSKKILATIGVNIPLHIPDVTDIAYLTIISTTSTSNITHPHTYEHIHRHLLPEKEGKKKIGSIQEIFDITYYNCEFRLSIRYTKANSNIYSLV